MAKKYNPVELDLDNLHFECARQADNFHKWAVKLAEAKYDADTAKSKLKVVEADLKEQIRSEPQKFGLAKATDDAVKSAVVLQEDYQHADADLIEKEYEAALIKAKVDSLEQKKWMLQIASALRMSDYFAEPVMTQFLKFIGGDAVDRHQKEMKTRNKREK